MNGRDFHFQPKNVEGEEKLQKTTIRVATIHFGKGSRLLLRIGVVNKPIILTRYISNLEVIG